VRLKPADAMHQFLRQRHQILAFERSSFIANVLIKVTHEEGGLMQYVSGIFKHSPEIALFLSLALGYWIGKFQFGKFQLGGWPDRCLQRSPSARWA
jgi:hypothetical protein